MAEVITKPVFWVIMVAIWALVFPMITGAYNSIYANTIDAAAITSERFERVMPKGTHTSAKDAWEARTAVVDSTATAAAVVATSAYKVGNDSGKCKIPVSGTSAGDEYYTPSGNVVVMSATTGEIADCKWEKRTPIFGFANGFIRVLLQMLALAAPLGFMLMLAYFGSMLVAMGSGHPIMQVIMTVILVLVGAILLNIALPYISGRLPGDRRQPFRRLRPGAGPDRRAPEELLRRDPDSRIHRGRMDHSRPDAQQRRYQPRILRRQRDVMGLFMAVLLLWRITQGLHRRGDVLPSLALQAVLPAVLLGTLLVTAVLASPRALTDPDRLSKGEELRWPQ